MKIEPFALERWMTAHETRVRYDIAESGICPLSMSELLAFEPESQRAESLDRLLRLGLGYSEACGTLQLRSILASTYAACEPDNILVTTGAIEANFLLFHVLLEAGDHVVAPYPAYQQLYSVPRAMGCDVSLWKIGPENDFRYELADLEKLVTRKTRLIVINSPHNPTGALLSAEDARGVYDLAASLGATVLSDEAYRWLTIPGGEPLAPPLFDLGPAAVSVGTLSKTFGLPGLRIGWIAAASETVARCWELRDYISLCPGKLNDALAVLALRHRERILARNAIIIQTNRAVAQTWVEKHADLLSWNPPRGGLLALLRYDLDVPSVELADKLADEYSVMLAPGAVFGYEHCLRIGIGQDPTLFATGLERASACFEALRR